MDTNFVNEKQLQKRERVNFYLTSVIVLVLITIFIFVWIWGNQLVAGSCTHFNCVHGWYSKYNETEKTLAILSRLISAFFLYFLGSWLIHRLPKTDVICGKCGSVMRKRYTRKGSYQGEWFYGCTKYPQCSGVRNILK